MRLPKTMVNEVFLECSNPDKSSHDLLPSRHDFELVHSTIPNLILKSCHDVLLRATIFPVTSPNWWTKIALWFSKSLQNHNLHSKLNKSFYGCRTLVLYRYRIWEVVGSQWHTKHTVWGNDDHVECWMMCHAYGIYQI